MADLAVIPKIEAKLTEKMPTMQTLAPHGFDVARLQKQALACVFKKPELADCEPTSFVLAVMQAAELGLDLAGGLPTAYLVPFKGKAMMIVSYRGLRELAVRSGTVQSIEAAVVLERDQFEWEQTENGLKFSHRWSWDARGPIVGFYALATLSHSLKLGERMSKAQVDVIKARSPAGNAGPWGNEADYVEMGRKTLVRRICKSLVLSPIMRRAIEIMDENEGMLTQPIADRTRPSTATSIIDAIPDQPHGSAVSQPTEPAAFDPSEIAAEMDKPKKRPVFDAAGNLVGEQ